MEFADDTPLPFKRTEQKKESQALNPFIRHPTPILAEEEVKVFQSCKTSYQRSKAEPDHN
jgi:hypothetical protein